MDSIEEVKCKDCKQSFKNLRELLIHKEQCEQSKFCLECLTNLSEYDLFRYLVEKNIIHKPIVEKGGETNLEKKHVKKEGKTHTVESPIESFFNDYIEVTQSISNNGLGLSEIWRKFQDSREYYKNGILMKHIRAFLDKKYRMTRKFINGSKLRVYQPLKWKTTNQN